MGCLLTAELQLKINSSTVKRGSSVVAQVILQNGQNDLCLAEYFSHFHDLLRFVHVFTVTGSKHHLMKIEELPLHFPQISYEEYIIWS